MGSLFSTVTDPATGKLSWMALLGLVLLILLTVILAGRIPFLKKLGA